MEKVTGHSTTPHVYAVSVDTDKCKGCRLCIVYCPTKHLRLSSTLNKRGVCFAEVAPKTRCTGCGVCFLMCPECCIEVYEKK